MSLNCWLPQHADGSPRSSARHVLNAPELYDEIATIEAASVSQVQAHGTPDEPDTVRWGSRIRLIVFDTAHSMFGDCVYEKQCSDRLIMGYSCQ